MHLLNQNRHVWPGRHLFLFSLQLFLAAKFKPPRLEYLGREDMGSVTVNMTLLALSL